MVLRCTLILALAAGAFAGPVRPSQSCTEVCAASDKFTWDLGMTYEYDYSADIKTYMAGASEEHSSLHLSATAKIEILSTCDFALRLERVDLKESEPRDYGRRQSVAQANELRRALQAKPLRFAFMDGTIQHICPDEEEPWVLNVKRGILSGMQLGMDSLDTPQEKEEIDISGRCPVAYSVSPGFRTNTITKVKDVMACRDGHQHDTIFHGIPYHTDSKIQSLPLVDSTHECQQVVNSDGIISSVHCSERHQFRPFSQGESGAVTTVETSLEYKDKSNGIQTRKGQVNFHEYLMYDSRPTPEEMIASFQDAQITIQSLCRNVAEDVRPETAGLFVRLVHDMRKMDAANLLNLHRGAASECPQATKFFRDALGSLNSAAAVSVIRQLIDGSEVSEMEAEIWLTSMSFIARPDEAMLSEGLAMLSMTGPVQHKAYLAVSSLVHNYCHVTKNCEQNRQVDDIIKKFEDKLSYNCRGDHHDVLLALKSLGNTGHAQRLTPIMSRCFLSDDLDMELRVEAIKAYRRMGCDVDRSPLMDVYRDITQDSELRINAYLEVMRCPSNDVIAQVRAQLEREQVNQVGSFVWTHLTNIVESSDPHKQEIADILMNEPLEKKFDLDKRKFSKNLEWSLFSNMLNTGGVVDGNLIFSEKSFMPRSASVNLTIDMFGHAMNLLEIGGHSQGIDSLLQRIFGPNQGDNSVSRNKRAAINQDDINVFDGKYGPGSPNEPKGGYYVRMFGNEIRYEDFHDFDAQALKDKFNFLNWLVGLSEEHDFELTKNSLFLDASYSVPTVAGVPLKLTAQGSSSINVKVGGKVDLTQLMSSPMKVDILGSIEPSAAVEIQSEMGVDFKVAKTGLKMVTTLHSSTVTSGKLQLEEGKIVSFDLNVPRDRLEILSVDSKFYISSKGADREQTMVSDSVYSKSECLDMAKSLGIELCAEASVALPNGYSPLAPFAGPSSLKLYGEKKDNFDKYHFQITYDQEMARNMLSTSTLQVIMNTPGSRVDREVSLYTHVNVRESRAELRLKSPWKQVTFNGNFQNEESLKALSLVAMVDERTEYSLNVNMPITAGKRDASVYSPEISLVWPGLNDPRIVGEVTYTPRRNKYDYTVRVRNVFSDPAKATGSFTMLSNANRFKTDVSLNIQSTFFEGEFSGFIDNTGTTLSTRTEAKYTIPGNEQQMVTFNAKVRDQSEKTLTDYEIDSSWTNTFFPDYNGDLKLEAGYGRNEFKFNLDTGFDQSRRLTLRESGSMKLDTPTKTAEGEFSLTLPAMDIAYSVSLDHTHNDNSLSHKWDVDFGEQYKGMYHTSLQMHTASPLRFTFSNVLHIPNREMELSGEIEQSAPGQYSTSLTMQLNPDYIATMNSRVKLRPTMELEGTLNVPRYRPIRVEAALNPVLSDFSFTGSADVNGARYSTEAKFEYNGNQRVNYNKMSFDLVLPSRHIVASSEYNYDNGLVTGNSVTQWDADNDASKQTSTVYRLALNAQSPALYVKTEWERGNFVELDTSGNYYDIYEASVILKSKIYEIEMADQYKFAFKFEPQNLGAKLHVEGSADEEKYEADLVYMLTRRLDNHEITLDLKTPWTTWRTIHLESSHEMSPKTLKMVGAFGWDDQEVRIISNNVINWKKNTYRGGITFTSPFEGLENVRVSVEHATEDHTHTTDVGVSWGGGRGKELSYDQTLTMIPGEKFSLDATFRSPFRLFQEIILKGSLEKAGDTFLTDNQIQWAEGRAITLVSELKLQRGWTWESMLRITTPWRAFERFVMNLNNQDRRGLMISHFDVEYAPTKKIEINTQMDLANYKKFFGEIICNACPYIGTTSFDVEMNGNLWQHDAKIELASNRLLEGGNILLTSNAALTNTRDMSATIKYQSPIGLPTMEIEFKHNQVNRVYTSSLTFTIPTYTAKLENEVRVVSLTDLSATTTLTLQGDVYQFTSSIKSERTLELSVMLTTPNPNWPQIGFEVTHTGQHTDFTTTLDITYGRDVKTETSVTYKNTENSLLLDAKVEGLFTKDITLLVSNEGGFYDNMDSRMELRYDNSQNQNTNQAMKNKIFSLMPFMRNPMRIIFTHSGSIMGFTSNLEMGVNRKAINIEAKYTMRGASFGGSLEITTPFEDARNVFLELNHNGALTDFTNDITWRLNGREYKMGNTFQYARRRLSVSTDITTPVEGYESITANFVHTGTLQAFTTEGEMNVNGKVGTVKAEFNMQNRLSVSLEMTTPFRSVRSLNLNFEHTGQDWSDFNSVLTFVLNRRSYSANLLFKWISQQLRLEANAATPGNEYAFNILHRGDLSDFTTTVTITTAQGDINAEVTWKMDDTSLVSNAEITTPYNNWERFTWAIDHQGGLDAFETSLSMTTPFRMFPAGSVSVSKSGDMSDFRGSAAVTWGRKTISGSANYAKTDRKMEAGASLETPFANFDNFGASFSHTWNSDTAFTTSASITTPFENFQNQGITLTYDGPLANLDSSVLVESSIPGYNRFKATLKNKMASDGLDASLKIETPIQGYENFEVTLTHAGPMTSFVSRISVETSIRGSRRFSVEVRYSQENGIASGFSIQTPWQEMRQMSGALTMTSRGDGFDFTVSLSTPFEKVEEQELTISHTMRNEWKNFDTTSELKWANGRQNVNAQVKWDLIRRDSDLTAMAKITSSMRNMPTMLDASLSYKNTGNGLTSSASIATPAFQPITVDVTYNGERTQFDATANIEWSGKRIETEASRSKTADGQTFMWHLKRTPWNIVQNLKIEGGNGMNGEVASGNAIITFNSAQKFNGELAYRVSMPIYVKIDLHNPVPAHFTLNANPDSPTTTADVLITYDSQTLSADMEYTCNSNYYKLDRKLVMNSVLPSGRPMKLELEVKHTDGEFKHKSYVMWKRGKEATSEIDLTSTYQSGEVIYTGNVKVVSPVLDQEASVRHVVVSGYQWTTTLTVPQGVTVRHDLMYDLPDLHHSLTVQHPRLRNDMKYEVNGHYNPDRCTIKGDFKLEVARESLNFAGRIEDESGNRERVVAEATLTHPGSNLDFSHSTLYLNSAEERSIVSDTKYLTSTDGQKTFSLNYKFNKLNKDMNLDLVNPLKSIHFVGSVPGQGVYVITCTGLSKSGTLAVKLGRTDTEVYIETEHDKGRNQHKDTARLTAQYNGMRNMKLELHHNVNGQQTQDFEFGIAQPRGGAAAITARTYIRQDITRDFGNYLLTVEAPSERLAMMQAFYSTAMEDLAIKGPQIRQHYKDAFETVLERIAGDTLRAFRTGYERMLRTNEFYLRDVTDFLTSMKSYVVYMNTMIVDMVNSQMQITGNRIDRMYQQAVARLNVRINALSQQIVAAIDEYFPVIESVHAVVEKVVNALENLRYTIVSHPWVQSYFQMLENIKNGEFMGKVRQFRMELMAWIDEMRETYRTHLAVLDDIWMNFSRRSEVREIRALFQNIENYFDYVNDNYDIEGALIFVAEKLSEITWEVISNYVHNLVQKGIGQSSITLWDPLNSNLELELYIPTDFLSDIRPDIPDLQIRERWAAIVDWMSESWPRSDWSFLDYYYVIKAWFTTEIGLPPFDSWATLTGTQHYMTFDKQFYEFAGDCSYLLARDFIDKEFAIVVNYSNRGGKRQKSITVTDGYNQAEIMSTGVVQKDGETTELPVVIGDSAILRENNMIRVSNKNGLEVTCDLTYDRCTVHVSGWYYGKTAGLLGTYDNEPVTDLMTSDRTLADDVNPFARSWAIGRCRPQNLADTQAPVPGTPAYRMCSQYFVSDESPFRPCFKVVDPEPFLNMCINDFARPDANVNQAGTCSSGAAYVEMCELSGSTINMPHMCYSCEGPEGDSFTEELTIEGNEVPKGADVVFVIQHAECNTAVVENLREILDDLDGALRGNGLRNNRYGVVGYGGFDSLNQPHSHTMGGKLMDTFQTAVQGLESWQGMEHGESDGTADTLAAIKFAAQYPFRAGVSKTIVVIPCESCQEHAITSSEVQKLLYTASIKLHVIMDHDFKLKSGFNREPQTAFRYGSDNEGIFTKKHLKGSLESDREIYNAVKLPGDYCAAIAQSSMGTIFDVNQFTDARKQDQKRFVQVMVRVFAERATPAECQKCECVAGTGQSRCRACANSVFDFNMMYPETWDLDVFDFAGIME